MTRWTEDQLADFLKRGHTAQEAANRQITQAAVEACRPRGRRMNKTEAAYDGALEYRRRAGEVVWFKFEAIKLRLADSTFYTPDFAVLLAGGALEMHEVKGFWRDDARVKIKVAAAMYPFRFIAVQKVKGGWKREEFGGE